MWIPFFLLVILLLLVVVVVVVVARLATRPSNTNTEHFDAPLTDKEVTLLFSNDVPPHKTWFCVYSQFKNECHVLLEWVDHYFREGADHIVLVDNDSNDKFQPSMLQHIPNLTLFSTKIKYRQKDVANYVMDSYLRGRCTWAIHLDMDEFLYTRHYPSVSDYLRVLQVSQPTLKAIVVPWKSFGSSGWVQQPPTVLDHFLWRDKDFPTVKHTQLVKTLFQPDYYELMMHIVNPYEAKHGRAPHVSIEGSSDKHYEMHPQFDKTVDLSGAELHLNHYAIQSRDYFEHIKKTRGDATRQDWNHIRTLDYFNDRDRNDVHDDELARKKVEKKPDLLFLRLPSSSALLQREWRRQYENYTRSIQWVSVQKPYNHQALVDAYGTKDHVLVVCPLHQKYERELDFVLSRTLRTGNSVFPEGHPMFSEPSTEVFAVGPLSSFHKECHIPYDGKVLWNHKK